MNYIEQKIVGDEKLYQINPRKMMFSPVHRSIGALTSMVGGKQCKGSATLLSSNLILTAAHNIYTKGKGQHINFKFYSAPAGEVEVQKYYEIESWRYQSIYETQNTVSNDYAVMKLKENVQMPIEYKNYCELLLSCEDCKIRDMQKMELLISGYPQQAPNYFPTNIKGKNINLYQYGLQKQGKLEFVDFKQRAIQYRISTLPGQSGCPVINEGNIIAIHVGGKRNSVCNIGRLITFDVLQNIQKWTKELNANQFLVNLKSFCQHNTKEKFKDINKKLEKIASISNLQAIINCKDLNAINVDTKASLDQTKYYLNTHMQKLYDDGVHRQDYICRRYLYETCLECALYFNKNDLPSLLTCGHVCCEQCLNQGTPCGCCGRPKMLRIFRYKLLISEQQQPNVKNELLYDFHIKIGTSLKTIHISNQKSNTIFGQILTQFDAFVNYEKSVKSKVRVIVITKSYFYHDIKDKPISDFLNILKSNYKRMSNAISIVGGI